MVLALTGEQGSPLGKSVNISSTCEKVVKRFALLDHAKMLLGSIDLRNRKGERPHATRTCHAYKCHNSEGIILKLNNNPQESRASYSGVQTCGNIHACPVCSSRAAAEKAEFLIKALRWAKLTNKKDFMLTLTARHNRYMTLEELETRFKAAWNSFTGHRTWRKLKKKLGISHWIANIEAPYGENGWHYHKHIILFCDWELLKEADFQVDFANLWIDCLALHGLEALPERAAKITTGSHVGDEYLTKCGIAVTESNGRLEYEMTGTKEKDSQSHWELLELSYYGNAHAGNLYIEYVQHMTGKNFLTTSHGLNDEIAALPEEAAAAADEGTADEMNDWAEISPYWWDEVIRPAKGMSEVLKTAAKTRNLNHVRELLWELQEKLIQSGALDDYHRKYRFVPYASDDFAEGIRLFAR